MKRTKRKGKRRRRNVQDQDLAVWIAGIPVNTKSPKNLNTKNDLEVGLGDDHFHPLEIEKEGQGQEATQDDQEVGQETDTDLGQQVEVVGQETEVTLQDQDPEVEIDI